MRDLHNEPDIVDVIRRRKLGWLGHLLHQEVTSFLRRSLEYTSRGRRPYRRTPVVQGAMVCGQKGVKLVWRYHQLLSGFLIKGHLPRVLRQSRRSLMIRVIMKLSWDCAHISWYLAEENPGNSQLGERLMKGQYDQLLP